MKRFPHCVSIHNHILLTAVIFYPQQLQRLTTFFKTLGILGTDHAPYHLQHRERTQTAHTAFENIKGITGRKARASNLAPGYNWRRLYRIDKPTLKLNFSI